eukprot:947712-Rhodomonas_salina.1
MTWKQPDESVIPTIFDYTDDPDYGQIYKDLTEPDSKRKQLQSDALYAILEQNLVWIDILYEA